MAFNVGESDAPKFGESAGASNGFSFGTNSPVSFDSPSTSNPIPSFGLSQLQSTPSSGFGASASNNASFGAATSGSSGFGGGYGGGLGASEGEVKPMFGQSSTPAAAENPEHNSVEVNALETRIAQIKAQDDYDLNDTLMKELSQLRKRHRAILQSRLNPSKSSPAAPNSSTNDSSSASLPLLPQKNPTRKKRKRKSDKAKPNPNPTNQCPDCNRIFSTKGNMTRHQSTHTGARPHVCEKCQKSFSRTDDLKSHEIIHTNDKPYPCRHDTKLCQARFKRMSDCTKHERRKHNWIHQTQTYKAVVAVAAVAAVVVSSSTGTSSVPSPSSITTAKVPVFKHKKKSQKKVDI